MHSDSLRTATAGKQLHYPSFSLCILPFPLLSSFSSSFFSSFHVSFLLLSFVHFHFSPPSPFFHPLILSSPFFLSTCPLPLQHSLYMVSLLCAPPPSHHPAPPLPFSSRALSPPPLPTKIS